MLFVPYDPGLAPWAIVSPPRWGGRRVGPRSARPDLRRLSLLRVGLGRPLGLDLPGEVGQRQRPLRGKFHLRNQQPVVPDVRVVPTAISGTGMPAVSSVRLKSSRMSW